MTRLIYAALLVLFLAPMTFAEDPKADTPEADVPMADVENTDSSKSETTEADAPEEAPAAPEADAQKADTPGVSNPDCDKILAEVKAAKAVHDTDYKAKGKAFYNWRTYNRQLHSISYEGTDKPLVDSVKKCEKEDKPGEGYCKRVMKAYNEISPKEKSAKKELDAAEAKSNKSRSNYNVLLAESHEMNCLVNQKQ